LFSNHLSGNIPSSIGKLTNLTDLELDANELTGIIPFSIGNLVNLTNISLDANKLSGSIPSSIGNLVNLYVILLSTNKLTGSIPASVGKLVNLQALWLFDNQLSGSIPSSIGNLPNLYQLYLSNNQLSGTIPSSLKNLTKINSTSGGVLNLNHNAFTFDGMELIAETFPNAKYDYQKNISINQNGNSLSVYAGGTLSNNTYKWFKCNGPGTPSILVATIKGDSVFHPSESGRYRVKIINSVATQLQLYTKLYDYSAPNNTLITSAENELQQAGKTNAFRVYPNPAKDILQVETRGTATFSLVDQSGKILLTTNITGKESINVSGISAGLYYLKNNSTNALQKVVIAR
jgi:hypothetical protein